MEIVATVIVTASSDSNHSTSDRLELKKTPQDTFCENSVESNTMGNTDFRKVKGGIKKTYVKIIHLQTQGKESSCQIQGPGPNTSERILTVYMHVKYILKRFC